MRDLALCRALLALLVVIATSFAAAESRDPPWQILASDLDNCQRPSVMETYNVGLNALKQGAYPSAADCFRRAIKERSTSGSYIDNDTRKKVVYFPYFQLARVYAEQGDIAAAQRCLDKENQALLEAELKGDYAKLRKKLERGKDTIDVLQYADQVRVWKQNGAMRLRSDADRIEKILQDMAEIERDGAGASSRAINRLSGRLSDMYEEEVERRREEIEQLDSGEYKETVPSAARAAHVCEFDGDDLARARASFEACEKIASQAWLAASRFVCERFRDARDRLTADKASPQGGSLPEVARLPGWCAPDRMTVKYTDLQNAHEKARAMIEADKSFRQEHGTPVDMAKVDAVLKTLVIPRDDCSAALGVQRQAETLATLAAQLRGKSAGADLNAAAAQAEKLQREIWSAVRQQARAASNETCNKVSAADKQRLAADLAQWSDVGVTIGQLQNLCDHLKIVQVAAQGCVESPPGPTIDLAAEARALRPRLIANRGWWEATQRCTTAPSLGLTVDDLSCLTGSEAAIRTLTTASAATESNRQTDGERQVRVAQNCLRQAERARTAWRQATVRLADDLEQLRASSSAAVPAELAEMPAALDRLVPVFQLARQTELPQTIAELREQLEAADLTAESSDLVSALGGGRPADDALGATRDAALARALGARCEQFPGWIEVGGSLGPLREIDGAFRTFARGDLDRAILDLRRALKRGGPLATGRPGYLAHAALAYFLQTKATVQRDASVKQWLEADLQQVAQAAARLGVTVSLPPELFPASFRRRFAELAR